MYFFLLSTSLFLSIVLYLLFRVFKRFRDLNPDIDPKFMTKRSNKMPIQELQAMPEFKVRERERSKVKLVFMSIDCQITEQSGGSRFHGNKSFGRWCIVKSVNTCNDDDDDDYDEDDDYVYL